MRARLTLTAAVLAALFVSVASAQILPREPIETTQGSLVWYPDQHDGWTIASITRTADGELRVYAAPDRIYQRATMRGFDYAGDVTAPKVWRVEYIEVIAERSLGATAAAAHLGWRDPLRITNYVSLVFDATAPASPGRRGGVVQVFSNGANYLIVITTRGLAKEMAP